MFVVVSHKRGLPWHFERETTMVLGDHYDFYLKRTEKKTLSAFLRSLVFFKKVYFFGGTLSRGKQQQ